eukprot:4985290-Prymnesium_polylepis.1
MEKRARTFAACGGKAELVCEHEQSNRLVGRSSERRCRQRRGPRASQQILSTSRRQAVLEPSQTCRKVRLAGTRWQHVSPHSNRGFQQLFSSENNTRACEHSNKPRWKSLRCRCDRPQKGCNRTGVGVYESRLMHVLTVGQQCRAQTAHRRLACAMTGARGDREDKGGRRASTRGGDAAG